MPQNNTHEKQFLDALQDIFIGAKVEGESGYINLMKIKANYYSAGVFPQLIKDIDEACRSFESGFREEMFDKLYDFFSRYFSESGSIYFRHTAPHHNVYERVYTDDRDVMLFWKTHMLYYVKTDRLFNSLEVEVDGERFFFDVSGLKHKQSNEKRDPVYSFDRREKDGRLVFSVAYSEKGTKTKLDEVLGAIKQVAGSPLDEDTLQKAFRVFEKQSEVDYFINKNARAFLQEQFDLWMYQYLFKGESAFNETRLEQLQAIRDIAFKIIDFIAQFEDELVKVWNKPKFARNSHYIITLDKIIERDEALLASLFQHEGMKAQMTEWRDLGMLGDNAPDSPADLLAWIQQNKTDGTPLHPQLRFLPLDTRHVADHTLDILALFDDLDAALDGWLVRSENYQAIHTLLPKFSEQVGIIYIDPPYNTAASRILYINDYKDSAWVTLIENRLEVARRFLDEDGFICITIDDYEVHTLKNLLSQLSNIEINGTTVIKNSPSGRPTVRGFRINHEYAIFASRIKNAEIGRLDKSQEQIALYKEKDSKGSFQWVNLRKRGGANTLRTARPKQFYPIYVRDENIRIPNMTWSKEKNDWIVNENPLEGEIVLYPLGDDGKERIWSLGHTTAREQLSELRTIKKKEGTFIFRKQYFLKGSLPSTWWDNAKYSTVEHGSGLIEDILGVHQTFSFPKSVYAVVDCLRVAGAGTDDSVIVLDFFAGSGTTAHAVMNLNRADNGSRKYILVEMGEHFNTVILPRVKKVAFSDKWKKGKADNGQGMSHFAKYYELEQYEDALRRARYEDDKAPLFAKSPDVYTSYVFMRDLKMLDAIDVDTANNNVAVHLDKLYDDIDLAETLSCLKGKWIKRITQDTVEFQDGTTASLSAPDWNDVKPLIWW